MIYTSCFQTHLVNGVFNFLVNFFFFFFKFYFIFKLYIIVLVLPNIKMKVKSL